MANWDWWINRRTYRTSSDQPYAIYLHIPYSDEGIDPTEECTLHWVPKDYVPDEDIRSYADLQRYSAKTGAEMRTGIGGEHPFLHVKETFPKYKFISESDPYQPDPSKPYELLDCPCFSRDYRYSEEDCGEYHYVVGNGVYYRIGVRYSKYQYGTGYSGGIDFEAQQYYIDASSSRQKMYYRSYSDSVRYSNVDKSLFDVSVGLEWLPTILAGLSNQTFRLNSYQGQQYFNRYIRGAAYELNSDLFDPEFDWREPGSKEHAEPAGLEASLCADAMANTAFNSNTIANGLELFDLAMSIKNGTILTDLIDKHSLWETSKNAWLTYRYSYSTTKADIEELGRYVEDCNQTICRARDVNDAGMMCVKIKIRPPQSEVKRVVDRLTSVGVAPNLYNLWDMVPFSFIVDWVVDVGGVLESITKYGRCNAYDIVSVTTSWKWDHVVERAGIKAKLTFYQRRVSSSVPPYIPYVESSAPGDATKLKRLFDTVALFS